LSVSLFAENNPERFWRPLVRVPQQDWDAAVRSAIAELPPACRPADGRTETLLALTLGEGQFGAEHWRLSTAKRLYYMIKPALPRALTRRLRRVYGARRRSGEQLGWPVEPAYVQFQLAVIDHLLESTAADSLPCIAFWPDGQRYAFVLTHDIETAEGQSHVRELADLDASFGFRSSFNFVPERYRVDRGLVQELKARGFEVGVHGLKHDGRDFGSEAEFRRRAERINRHLHELGGVGFRAPLTLRNPEWMQALEIEYDSSFFDTDPYEPIAGGTMSIWPFQLGRFIELPYTLMQDYTLASVLGELTPRLWLEKVGFIREHHGLALLNTHPDYLRSPATRRIYSQFLRVMSERRDYYHALPQEIARWWRARSHAATLSELPGGVEAAVERSFVPAAKRALTRIDGFRQTVCEVRPMQARDVAEVAELHRTALPDWFLAAAGRRFLEMFYTETLKTGEIAYVAVDEEGLVAGFVMGSVRPRAFSRALLRSRALDLLLAGGLAAARSPRSWPRIAAAARKPFVAEDTGDAHPATLMFVAVSPWTESTGVGRRLVDTFVREAGHRGADRITLTTRVFNNERANWFYKRLGFEAVAERRRGDREWVRDYQLDLVGLRPVLDKLQEGALSG
jgi:ribosomal protein S18 acetylase RimI-like enzyme/peptidoglycan/xylan/chitin deacetylase (PgdA/CDA1 family)